MMSEGHKAHYSDRIHAPPHLDTSYAKKILTDRHYKEIGSQSIKDFDYQEGGHLPVGSYYIRRDLQPSSFCVVARVSDHSGQEHDLMHIRFVATAQGYVPPHQKTLQTTEELIRSSIQEKLQQNPRDRSILVLIQMHLGNHFLGVSRGRAVDALAEAQAERSGRDIFVFVPVSDNKLFDNHHHCTLLIKRNQEGLLESHDFEYTQNGFQDWSQVLDHTQLDTADILHRYKLQPENSLQANG